MLTELFAAIVVRSAAGLPPVEAPQPGRVEVSLAVAREAVYGTPPQEMLVLIRESGPGRDGVPLEFAASSPDGWHEDRTTDPGRRTRVWATPNLFPDGTGSLICEVEHVERLTRGRGSVGARQFGVVGGSGPPNLLPEGKVFRHLHRGQTGPRIRTEAWVRAATADGPTGAVADTAEGERDSRSLEEACAAHFRAGRFEEEVEARAEFVSRCRLEHGDDHWRTKSEASLLEDARRAAAATAEDRVRVLDARRRYVAAVPLLNAGRYADAVQELAPGLPAAQQVLGKESWLCTEMTMRMGVGLNGMGRHADALVLLRLAEKWLTGIYGRSDSKVAEALSHISDALLGLDRGAEAREAAEKAFTTNEASAAGDVKTRALGYHNLATFYNKAGEFAAAERRVAEASAFTRGSDDDDVTFLDLLLRRELARSYAGQGKPSEAAAVYREAIREVADHPRRHRVSIVARSFDEELKRLEPPTGE